MDNQWEKDFKIENSWLCTMSLKMSDTLFLKLLTTFIDNMYWQRFDVRNQFHVIHFIYYKMYEKYFFVRNLAHYLINHSFNYRRQFSKLSTDGSSLSKTAK